MEAGIEVTCGGGRRSGGGRGREGHAPLLRQRQRRTMRRRQVALAFHLERTHRLSVRHKNASHCLKLMLQGRVLCPLLICLICLHCRRHHRRRHRRRRALPVRIPFWRERGLELRAHVAARAARLMQEAAQLADQLILERCWLVAVGGQDAATRVLLRPRRRSRSRHRRLRTPIGAQWRLGRLCCLRHPCGSLLGRSLPRSRLPRGRLH